MKYIVFIGKSHEKHIEIEAKNIMEASKMIKEIGLKAALKKIMDKKGTYVWKDTYLFCIDDKKAKVLAHPVAKRLVGFKMTKWKDVNLKQPFKEVLEVAKTKGKGWISYKYVKRGDSTPSLKTVYFLKVPGEKVIVCAGIYE